RVHRDLGGPARDPRVAGAACEVEIELRREADLPARAGDLGEQEVVERAGGELLAGERAAHRIAVGRRRGSARAERKGEAERTGEAGKLDLHGMGPTDCDGMRQRAAWAVGRALSWMECVGGVN